MEVQVDLFVGATALLEDNVLDNFNEVNSQLYLTRVYEVNILNGVILVEKLVSFAKLKGLQLVNDTCGELAGFVLEEVYLCEDLSMCLSNNLVSELNG